MRNNCAMISLFGIIDRLQEECTKSHSVMNGYQALLTFLGIFATTGSDLFAKYTRGPGNVYHGRYTRDLHQPEFLIPRRVLGDGSFDTYSLPNYYDRRELNERRKRSTEADKLHLVLPFNGIEHHVELTPYHEFISPDMVIETRGAGLRTNFNEAVRFKRAPDRQCHYRGIIRGHRASRAALSLCDGVVGYVQTNQGRYFIEPVSESQPEQDGQHVHVAYKRNAPHEKDGHDDSSKRHCGTHGTWEASWAEQLAKREKRLIEEGNSVAEKRVAPGAIGAQSLHRYIEIGLVADRKFLDYHNNTNYEQFLLTVMNMVADYYHDVSVGNQIDVVLVRMIYLEKEKEEIDLTISPAASETLDSFAKWAMKANPADHDHPNHFDISVLVTRHDICSKTTGCGLTGLAFVAAACDPAKASSINEESGLLLGVVIAHEVGHVMGSDHDEAKDDSAGCQSHDKDGSYFIMSPLVGLFTIRWSPCSRRYISSLLDSGLGDCLNDNPKKPSEKLKLPNMLPGAMYDGDYQCNLVFPGSKACPAAETQGSCDRLWCTKDPPDTGCITLGGTVADGTKCGENKWCVHLKCVDRGSRPAAVNGGWGAWGPLSACTRTCGGGVKVSERECDKPVPANGGRYCLGERKKIVLCNTTPCDMKAPSFRSIQCSMFDKVPVLTDGLHTWKPYMSPEQDPCALFCFHEGNVVTRIAPLANDSTPCRGGTNDMCISGSCRKVGCDWVLDSAAIEDKCGVCKGDGTRCKVVEGHFTERKGSAAFTKIVTVPKNARHIHVVEDAMHRNFLVVRLQKNKTPCLNQRFEQDTGDYLCGNFLIMYTHSEPHKEEILIKGPISENIDILYGFMDPENVGVHYSYAMVSDDPSHVPKYLWDFTEWSECDVRCGGGTKVSEATCIEETGGAVSPSYCEGIPKPEPKSRTCNTDPCPAKWRVSQWSKCSACDNNKGSRHRKVQCVRPAARFGEDDVQANLDACKGRVPRQKEDCIGKRPCKKTCPKKARNANEELGAEKEKQWTSVEDQAKMIDRFVDLNLARYLEEAHGMSREDDELARASGAADFRQLLRDWSTIENKKKRRDCIPVNLTLPKPGSIAVDSVPIEDVVVVEAPIMNEGLQMNISDRAYQETGDIVGAGLDTTREKIYRGKAAVKKLDEIHIKNKYTNATDVPPSKEENDAYDRLSRIVDAVDQ